MSLGFDVDFLAVIGLVNQVRKSFAGAPEQFKAISNDVRAFSIILQDIGANYTELNPEQSQEYQSIVTSCKHLLVQLEKTLEKYACVAEVGKAGKKTAIKRAWKRLRWEPDDVRDIRDQISVKIATLRSLNDQVTSHNIAKLVRHQEDTERGATLKWISKINYVAQQNDFVLRCQTGSRRWLFESEIYLEWCKRKGSLLFCPGNPGTGKTFTTAMVVESLRLANDAETLTAYMYCTYQNHTQTIEKLLCSLLRVALEEADHEADGAVSTCRQLRLSNKAISRQLCLGLLQDLFSRFARVNLMVDAVDEVINEVRRPFINDLLKLHERGNVSLFITSRIIPEIQHLFQDSGMYTSLEVRSSDEDIRNFLRDNIHQLPSFVARSRELQDDVIKSVTNASVGMFLLAELYLKSLANMISVGRLRTRISNLATGSNAYDTLYEDSMLRIGCQGSESERIATQMLLVLTCARRPLSPLELSHALSIDENSETFDEDMVPDMDDLVAACTGLVVLDDTSNIVHLVHKSAAEYFERTRSRWFPKANEKMALICLRYLQIGEKKPEETRNEQAPFFHYAKANWSYHSMKGEKEATNKNTISDASQTNSATSRNASSNTFAVTQLTIQQMTKEVVDVHSSIVEACHAGHQAWVEQLLVVRNYDMNIHGISQKSFISEHGSLIAPALPTKPPRDNVLLTIAATRGDYGMAQMLLAHGADPNIFNAMGQTTLIIAATNGFENLVSLLLNQKRTQPDLICRHSGGLSTALLASIEFGREGCFKMLLEKSNRGVRDSYNRGAMWLAASSGHSGIISELLKWYDVEIDYADTKFCGNPLTAAVRGGHENAALLLLPYSRCQSCSSCGITPIHYAVRNRFHTLLERLLEHDASAVNSELYTRPPEGRHFLINCGQKSVERTKTPLINAITLRDAQATQILLPYADANQGLTWRPLHGAAEWDNAKVFERLLEQPNVEPDPVDDHGRTPFLLAAERGNCDIINALIQKGDVQFDRKDTKGYAASQYIIQPHFRNSGYFRALASVLDIDVNKKDSKGSNLLHKACCQQPKFLDFSRFSGAIHVELSETNSAPLVNEMLKRPGVDVNLRDWQGMTPLLLAVQSHQRDVVRSLLDREDTNVLAQDEKGNDALLLASLHIPIFMQLLCKPASSMKTGLLPSGDHIPARYMVDNWAEVMGAEFKEYDESIFNMLLHDKRAKLYGRNNRGESIMARVAMTGSGSMAQAVLETTELVSDSKNLGKVEENLCSPTLQMDQDNEVEGRTPLSYVVQRVTGQATHSLLEAETNTNAANRSGNIASSYTSKEEHDIACLTIAPDKALINIPDCDGLTPLMHASRQLNIPVMSVFLERPNIDVLALDGNGHSFLCYLMTSHCFNKSYEIYQDIFETELPNGYDYESEYRFEEKAQHESENESTKELDGVIHRIHHILQLHVGAIGAHIHSPFMCTLENNKRSRFKSGFAVHWSPKDMIMDSRMKVSAMESIMKVSAMESIMKVIIMEPIIKVIIMEPIIKVIIMEPIIKVIIVEPIIKVIAMEPIMKVILMKSSSI